GRYQRLRTASPAPRRGGRARAGHPPGRRPGRCRPLYDRHRRRPRPRIRPDGRVAQAAPLMSFRSPWMLVWLLALPVLAPAYASARGRRPRQAVRLAAQGLVDASVSSRPRRRRHIPFAMFLIALAVLVVALARPITTIKTPRREATVVL